MSDRQMGQGSRNCRREQYEEPKRIQSWRAASAASAPLMRCACCDTHTNKKGETLSQFEFEAMCQRWCAVFGELPPLGPPDEAAKTGPNPLPSDAAILRMKDVVRTGYPRAQSSVG